MFKKKIKDSSKADINEPVDTSVIYMDYSKVLKLYCHLKKCSLNQVNLFIDKIAVWYELKYSDKRIKSMEAEETYSPIFGIMKPEEYVKSPLDDLEIKDFINTLTNQEKYFLRKPHFIDRNKRQKINIEYQNLDHQGLLYMTGDNYVEFGLSKNGTITYVERASLSYLIGHKITELPEIMMGKGLKITKESQQEIDEYNKIYEDLRSARKILLRAIARRIIDRATSNNFGLIRAIEFARDFGFTYELLMDYGIPAGNYTITRAIVNEYIRGLDIEMSDLRGEYPIVEHRKNKISMRDLLKKLNHYTPEEHELHDRLATALLQGIDMGKLEEEARAERDEEVKRFRIERKIDKPATK